MKVFTSPAAFTVKEDIQIQTAVARLYVEIKFANGTSLSAAKAIVKLRAISTGSGATTIQDPIELQTCFEIAAAKEGYYRRDENTEGQPWVYRGFIDVSHDGALACSADAYLSLDIKAAVSIQSLKIWAMGAPIATHKYLRVNPVTVQGTVKDIPLAGIDAIVVRPQDVDALKLQYDHMSNDLEKEEIEAMALMINDLVSVTDEGKVRAGYENWVVINTEYCSRAVIEPTAGAGDNGQFPVYLLSTQTLI
jgi:hypothetical protein